MVMVNPSQFSSEAMNVLKILHEDARVTVVGKIDFAQGVISADNVLNAIRACASNVGEMVQLIAPELREGVKIQSGLSGDRERRTVNDVITGIKNSAFCLDLAGELGLFV